MNTFLFAVASLTLNSISQNPTTRTVTIDYTLSGENAVVTLEGVTTNGAPMAASDLYVVTGDANKLVTQGTHRLKWQPPVESGFGPYDANSVEIALKAWSVDAPPDYMVLDLDQLDRGLRYYTSEAALPGGISDRRYKTKNVVFRRIPAAGVVWRKGSPTTESGRAGSNSEATHYVKLTHDYYLSVYELTRGQYKKMTGDFFLKTVPGGSLTYKEFRIDDWDFPECGFSYTSLRSRGHQATCTAEPSTVFKSWPQNGFELDAADLTTCPTCGAKGYRPALQKMRMGVACAGMADLMFDIPTDAEWEFACRGGREVYEVRPGALDETAWYRYNSSNATDNAEFPVANAQHRVGLKKPNGYGLYDMIGNVAEWCRDWYVAQPNTTDVQVDPIGPAYKNIRRDSAAACTGEGEGASYRVIHGGSFCSTEKSNRTARRADGHAYYANLYPFGDDKLSSAPLQYCVPGCRLWLPCQAVR